MPERDEQQLSYASPGIPAPARTSRLAYLALIVGILSTPCFTGGLFPRDALVKHDVLSPETASGLQMTCGPFVSTILCVVALARIYRSDGALRGAWAAGIGLAVSLFWLVTMFTAFFLLPDTKISGPL